MDGGLPNARPDRGAGEYTIDQLSHGDSYDCDTELNNGRDFMYHVPLYPYFWTNEAAFSMCKEILSSQAVLHTVPAYLQPQYRQFSQQLPRNQQLQHHVNPLSFLTAPPLSSMSMHAPLPPMITPSQKSSLQTTLGHLSTEPTTEEIEELEQMKQSVETFENLKAELAFGMGGDLPNAREDQKTGAETDDEMSDEDSCDSNEEINVVDVDDDAENDDGLSQPLNLTMSSKYKATTNVHPIPTSNRKRSHDTTFRRGLVTGVKGLQSAKQDRDLMYRLQQFPHLQTDQAAFPLRKEKLSSEAFAHSMVSQSAAAHQQYQPYYQQVRLHVTSLPDRAPLPRSLTYMHDPPPLMTTTAQKRPSQMTLGDVSAEPNTEKMKKMEEIQESVRNFKKQRTELDSKMDGNLRNAKSDASNGKDTDFKTSDETRHDSDEKSKIVPVSPVAEELQLSEQDIQQQFQHYHLQSTQPSAILPPYQLPTPMQDMIAFQNQSRVSQHTETNPERMTEEEEMQKLVKTFKIRRIELGYTQETISNELNNLSRAHNMYEVLSTSSIVKIETQKFSIFRMLRFKPLLELWLESKRNKTILSDDHRDTQCINE